MIRCYIVEFDIILTHKDECVTLKLHIISYFEKDNV